MTQNEKSAPGILPKVSTLTANSPESKLLLTEKACKCRQPLLEGDHFKQKIRCFFFLNCHRTRGADVHTHLHMSLTLVEFLSSGGRSFCELSPFLFPSDDIPNSAQKPGAVTSIPSSPLPPALSLSVCWISGFAEMEPLTRGASLSSE